MNINDLEKTNHLILAVELADEFDSQFWAKSFTEKWASTKNQ
jgi:hypothetical protein